MKKVPGPGYSTSIPGTVVVDRELDNMAMANSGGMSKTSSDDGAERAQPTEEQKAILATAQRPMREVWCPNTDGQDESNRVVTVYALAGSGKTWTLQHFVEALGGRGHVQVQYVVFNRSNAEEAKSNMTQLTTRGAGLHVRCSTVDGLALRVLRENTRRQITFRPCDSAQVKAIIEVTCKHQIAQFLGNLDEHSHPKVCVDLCVAGIYEHLKLIYSKQPAR
jgi:superfamily I DNA/RNA helicase